MTSVVYNLWNEGLGDHWASINLLAQMSIAQGRQVRFHSKPEHHSRHAQILIALEGGLARVLPQDEPGTADLDGFNVWATEYLPTKRRWYRSGVEPVVCTHFEGISAAADKNPPPADRQEIEAWAAARGLKTCALTGGMTLSEVIWRLATCTLFVGCDSGMSHIAHSVGCPTYLLEYRLPVVTCHRHKAYIRCDGAGHFTQQAANWLGYLQSLG